MEIAVIGGGNGGYASAVDLSSRGHSVRFWRQNADAFSTVLSSGEIILTDWKGTRSVPIDTPTTNIFEALEGAELIVIPVPCTAHGPLSLLIAPYLQDGQVVLIPPATFGTYIFARALMKAGRSVKVAFAETGTLPYLARKQSEDHVRISVYATRLPTGVFPANDTNRALTTISEAYSSIEPLQDALDGALMNAGPIIHPPLIIMNAGPLEHFDAWDIHNEGTQPSIRKVTDALDKERVRLREALGYGEPHFPLANHYSDNDEEWMYGNSSHKKLTDSGDWRECIDLRSHRYMQEDTALGLSFMLSLANWIGLDLPITQGLLAIASAITGENLFTSERTFEKLGLKELSRNKLNLRLTEGFSHD